MALEAFNKVHAGQCAQASKVMASLILPITCSGTRVNFCNG